MTLYDIIGAIVAGSICYALIGMFVYAVIVHGANKFRGVERFWSNWDDWKRAYNLRVSIDKNSPSYPQARRDERREVLFVKNQILAAMTFLFWPVALVAFVIYGIYKFVKVFCMIFVNGFKILDSLKGE